MITSSSVHGIQVPLVVPFLDGGAVDMASFRNLVAGVLASGAHGLVINGTTGEAPTLDWEEVEALFLACKEENRGRLPITLGVGTNNTAKTVHYAKRAKILGADAILIVAPYYSRPSQAGVIQHFREAAKVGLPIIAYNIPYRTGLDLDLDTLEAMLSIPEVIGLKESTNGLGNTLALSKSSKAVLCGEDAFILPSLICGAKGGILAAANVFTAKFVELHKLFIKGKMESATAAFQELAPLIKLLFKESNPAPLKYVLMKQHAIASETLRLPMTPISAGLRVQLDALLESPPFKPS